MMLRSILPAALAVGVARAESFAGVATLSVYANTDCSGQAEAEHKLPLFSADKAECDTNDDNSGYEKMICTEANGSAVFTSHSYSDADCSTETNADQATAHVLDGTCHDLGGTSFKSSKAYTSCLATEDDYDSHHCVCDPKTSWNGDATWNHGDGEQKCSDFATHIMYEHDTCADVQTAVANSNGEDLYFSLKFLCCEDTEKAHECLCDAKSDWDPSVKWEDDSWEEGDSGDGYTRCSDIALYLRMTSKTCKNVEEDIAAGDEMSTFVKNKCCAGDSTSNVAALILTLAVYGSFVSAMFA